MGSQVNVVVTPLTPEQRRDRQRFVEQLAAKLWQKLGIALRGMARLIGVAESTLRSWISRVRTCGTRVSGRPRRQASRLTRNDVFGAQHAAAGTLTVSDLKVAYPHVSRRELERLSNRYRRIVRKRRRRGLAILRWAQAGAVWAMDFTHLPAGVEDLGNRVLVVRDLSSGATLRAEPCESENADDVCRTLSALIDEVGAPLVLKSDNGSGFVAERTRALLEDRGVLPLYSPPGTPAYNGACEAGVGSVKHRAQALAALEHSQVTLDHLHAAREQANDQLRDRRAGAPRRRDAWGQRPEIEDGLRARLHERVDEWRRRCRTEQGIALGLRLPHAEHASIDRFAIGRALRELRLLHVLER